MVSNIYNESEKNKSENSIQAPSILFVNPIKKKNTKNVYVKHVEHVIVLAKV